MLNFKWYLYYRIKISRSPIHLHNIYSVDSIKSFSTYSSIGQFNYPSIIKEIRGCHHYHGKISEFMYKGTMNEETKEIDGFGMTVCDTGYTL